MRVATVRVFGVFLVALAVSIALSRTAEWRAASTSATFDLTVGREVIATLIAAAMAMAAFFGGWRLFHNPSGAAPRVIGAAVLILAASLALGMRGLEPPSAWSMTPRQREAFEYLRSTELFEMSHVGISGVRSRGYAGQLYGLCGLYKTDPLAFSAALPRYRRSFDSVELFWGCLMETKRVADVAGALPALFNERDHDEPAAWMDEQLAEFHR